MEQDKPQFLLGLDLGTTALKGVVVNFDGEIIAEAAMDTCFVDPHSGWFEIDPATHYCNVCCVIKELVEQTPGEIIALAMAAASGNSLLTDESGKPLTNIMSWMDKRTVDNVPEVLSELSVSEVWDVTGWPCLDTFPLAHFAWLRANESEKYKNAGRYCMNSDWLLFKLTGEWVMDYSTATTSHLLDQTSFSYHKKFLDLLDIPENKLSRLVPSACGIGKLTTQAMEDTGLSELTEVVSGSFDHPSAARALGVLNQGQLMLSCGTSWVGFLPEADRQKMLELELLCDPFLAPGGGLWGGIFSVPYIGRTVNWYVDNQIAAGECNKFKIFDELAACAKPGAGGLKIDLCKTPEFIDDSLENISRAVMEGAAHLLNAKLKNLALKGVCFSEAVMVGGPSKSPVWPGIVEDITGLNLSVGSQHAGAQGAAVLAGIGAGVYKNEHDFLNHFNSN